MVWASLLFPAAQPQILLLILLWPVCRPPGHHNQHSLISVLARNRVQRERLLQQKDNVKRENMDLTFLFDLSTLGISEIHFCRRPEFCLRYRYATGKLLVIDHIFPAELYVLQGWSQRAKHTGDHEKRSTDNEIDFVLMFCYFCR